jgi:hypothetical protein
MSRHFRNIMEKLQGGTDSTKIISADRDRRLE